MKPALYERYANALDDVLHNTQGRYVEADCYTITCKSGPVMRYTTLDFDVAFLGNTFSSREVRVDDANNKATGTWNIGLDVATWQVYFYPRVFNVVSGDLDYQDRIGSIPFVAACHGRMLDGASAQVDRVVIKNLPDPPMRVITPDAALRMFDGTIAEVDISDPGIILNINSLVDRFNRPVPGRLIQIPCPFTLFDVDCKLAAASFKRSSSVGIGSTSGIIQSSVAAPPGSGTYVLGRLTMTSGLNTRFSRLIRAWNGTQFTLAAPFYFDLEVGDTFDAFAGCDKRYQTCGAFANTDNFGGQRFIPAPEVAI